MSNTYYRYSKRVSPSVKAQKAIELTAVNDESHGVMINIAQIHPNGSIQAQQHIVLTEQEQNDLIAGILERRGGYFKLCKVDGSGMTYGTERPEGISATGNVQSAIHPAEILPEDPLNLYLAK